MKLLRSQRGNALPETIVVASFLMMMVFGTLNLTLLGYNQVQADGAAFVGARTASLTAQTNPSNAQSAAQTEIAAVFPHVSATQVAVASGGTSVVASAASVNATSPSLPFFNDKDSGPLKILSHAAEPTTFSSPPPTDIAFQVNSATLANYTNWSTKVSNISWQAHLAQSMRVWCNDPNINFPSQACDQGVLAVDETCYHDTVYDELKSGGGAYAFPVSGTNGRTPRATALAELNNFSPSNTASPQYQIAQWDAGNSPDSTGACGTVNYYPSPSGT
jgi:Flp pilus assembly protein TadG